MNRNLSEFRITIAGFGLMGGSLAMALRMHVAEIRAVDRSLPTLQWALERGIADAIDTDIPRKLDTDLLILATPIRVIIDILKRLPTIVPAGCAVFDLGSTKRPIMEAMNALPPEFEAVGGHPMCGREVSGIEAAGGELFEGQTFILCRSERTSPRLEQSILGIVDVIGARPLFLSAESHDGLAAAGSHLPYAASAALLRLASVAAEADKRIWQVSASGLRDTTRLAGSNPEIMLDILLTNREFVLEKLHNYEKELSTLVALLEANDEVELREWLADVKRRYWAYRTVDQGEGADERTKG